MSTTDIAAKPTSTDGTDRPRWAAALRALALRLHFYAGIFVGPFLLIAAISGALYAVAPTLETYTEGRLLHVDSHGPQRPLSEQVAAGVAARPDLTLVAVAPAPEEGGTTRVIFSDPMLGESERRAVFIDPVTARPVGDAVVYGSSGALPVRTWISQLHRHLHLGEPGRLYAELAASWLWVIALAGLLLWVRRVRSRRHHNSVTWLFVPGRSRNAREGSLNWHATVGMWILPVLLFLSATGLTWSTYAGQHIDELRQRFDWTTPTLITATTDSPTGSSGAADHSAHGHGGAHTHGHHENPTDRVEQLDRVIAAARAAGLDRPVEISVPADAGTAFAVQETRRSGTYTIDAVAVDGATGTVTALLPYSDWPFMAKLANWGIQLHMGLLFGPLNQLLLFAVAVGLITVIVRGYLMWWRRRPTRDAEWFIMGRPPRRGALRRVPWPAGLTVLAMAACIGWFAPVFGFSLLGFLVTDVIVGLGRRFRTTA
ncbi:PepSY-associated TM helix domain-containing protein [Nocardia paucivorans]|uniref:PepSY-associated TM helix domain-containing protein n=1 Tax=Nocardia paucivorans TaxID=114259 RepID=UPI00031AE298|nr:PepSY-associated TM helix domain-containing protein [Nocardia paucivorans]